MSDINLCSLHGKYLQQNWKQGIGMKINKSRFERKKEDFGIKLGNKASR